MIPSNSNWSHYSIITFDITTELFGEFQLPEFLAQKHFLKVSVVGESSAVIHSSALNFDGLQSDVRFWALGETRTRILAGQPEWCLQPWRVLDPLLSDSRSADLSL
ncbi:hypothetical protein OSB04_013107 [Centaurea solstitialis]|uniref:Uncharacterized protein n=1 Tax=Centaurea solstitialis TaxID=347529 RepID=A0AA38TCM3_9ASTR|nr:hypothetical protein OSB04_013107 [Centaurea solstitialis]